jgi:D-lactate dehydrogenase (cytochrome)
VFACLVYFTTVDQLFSFVDEARKGSFGVSPRVIELFDAHSLDFLRQSYPQIPLSTAGAIYFEAESTAKDEERDLQAWLDLMDRCGALSDQSWAALDADGHQKLKEFRHRLPVLINEWLTRQNESKVSTDMAVPDDRCRDLFNLYREGCERVGLAYILFGHIGNAHLHLNILPRDREEFSRSKLLYRNFVSEVLAMGGTLSAEHGIGKLKSEYLVLMFGENGIREMVRVKKALDPYLVLNIGNLIPKSFYESVT